MILTFEVIDDETIQRIDADGSTMFIPVNSDNGHYQRYLRWLETGSEFAHEPSE